MSQFMYLLSGKTPYPVNSTEDWNVGMEGLDRRVSKTQLDNEISVSTVFLGLDHNGGDGEPILFETMVFGGKLNGKQGRYTNWNDAEKGHEMIVEMVKNAEAQ